MTPMLAGPAGTAQATLEPDDEPVPAAAGLFLSPDELLPRGEPDDLEEPDESLPDELLLLAVSLLPFSPEPPEPPSLPDEPSLPEPFADAPAGAPAVAPLRLSVR